MSQKNMERPEVLIRKRAYELGFEKCGIIPVSFLKGYGEMLEDRMQKVPESEPFYRGQKRLANYLSEFPWAKSIVVTAVSHGIYRVPEEVKDHIGKSYLFDIRVDANTKEYRNNNSLEEYMKELGLHIETNRKFGVVGLRWAAAQAGLGIVRRNNFFYTESGSWVHLDGWLTDREMELKEVSELPQCPENCGRCIGACPTGSLSEPFTMSPVKCISFLTTFGGRDLPNQPLCRSFGECIYGCDICQDVCPMNKGRRSEREEFPGLAELAPQLTPEKIIEMDEGFYKEKVQPKFFYLKPDELWKWKVNALCYMRNHYSESFSPYIHKACEDENEKTREMANNILRELEEYTKNHQEVY